MYLLQPRKYQLINSQVSDISKSVVDSTQQSSRCNLNTEKVVHFFKIVKSCQNNHLGLFHYFQTPSDIFGKRNQHLSIPSYCDQSEINKVIMYISRLIQIFDRKCQFHVFDNYLDV